MILTPLWVKQVFNKGENKMFFDDFYCTHVLNDTDTLDYLLSVLESVLNQDKSNVQCFRQKKDNNAPKAIEGQYNLTINGNSIVLSDKSNGIEVIVKCHPDDIFDIGEGMKVAFDKYKEQIANAKSKKAKVRRKLYVGNLVMIKKNTWVFDEDQYVKTPQDIVGYITRMYTVNNNTLCEIQSTDRKYEFTANAKNVELIEQ